MASVYSRTRPLLSQLLWSWSLQALVLTARTIAIVMDVVTAPAAGRRAATGTPTVYTPENIGPPARTRNRKRASSSSSA